jgi:Spy/CpxP family protein refolding chaperone
MSRNTLTILLILSVALNIGLLGTITLRHVVVSRAMNTMIPSGFHSWLADDMLDDTQRETIEDIISENRDEMNDIMDELSVKRSELLGLMRADEPDSDAVEMKIAEIAELQRELEQMIAEQMMEVHSVLTPEQVEKFTTHMEERLCPGGERGRWSDDDDTEDGFRGMGSGKWKGKGWRYQNKNDGNGYCPQ